MLSFKKPAEIANTFDRLTQREEKKSLACLAAAVVSASAGAFQLYKKDYKKAVYFSIGTAHCIAQMAEYIKSADDIKDDAVSVNISFFDQSDQYIGVNKDGQEYLGRLVNCKKGSINHGTASYFELNGILIEKKVTGKKIKRQHYSRIGYILPFESLNKEQKKELLSSRI